MHRLRHVPNVLILLLTLAWPTASAPPTSEKIRNLLLDVAVRIDVEALEQHGICTGWIGWSEQTRSAVYTAAHCHREGARYRLALSNGETAYASNLARWEALDLMVLWIPRGGLRALRTWKPLPDGPFRALYVINDRGRLLRLVDVQVPRVYYEIRIEKHPVAVALPLYSFPGTSGAPIIDHADGLLLGMVVGTLNERPDVAAVIRAQHIYEALISSTPSR